MAAVVHGAVVAAVVAGVAAIVHGAAEAVILAAEDRQIHGKETKTLA